MKRYRCVTHNIVLVDNGDKWTTIMPHLFARPSGCYLLTTAAPEPGAHGACTVEVL